MTDKREKSLVKQKVKEERMTEQRIGLEEEKGSQGLDCFSCQARQYCSDSMFQRETKLWQ